MMKRALILASVASMIDQFNIPNIKLLQDLGYEIHVACNFIHGSTCSDQKIQILQKKLQEMKVLYYQIDFARNILKIGQNLKAYQQVKAIFEQNDFDLLHGHSPIGGFIGRMVAKRYRKKGLKTLYTAHGFHFYKGAPLKNWLIYYPIEKFCSRWTDVLITINQEDFALARKKMKAKRVEYVPGVGIDLDKFNNIPIDQTTKRKELGIPENATLLLSVGELNENKNHEVIIRAIADLNIYYMIAGKGSHQQYLQNLIDRLGLSNRVFLLGFRTDIGELLKASNIYALPSIREGLNVSLMEAMASGLPCIAGKIRGNIDLINENGGCLFCPTNVESCRQSLLEILKSDLTSLGQYNKNRICFFSQQNVLSIMKKIYNQ